MTTADFSMSGSPSAPRAGGALASGRVALPVLIYLFCVVIPIGFYAGPLFMTTLRLVTLVVVVPMTVRLLMGKYGPLLATDYLFFLHLGWSAVALQINNPDQMVQQIGSVGAEFMGGYLIGRAYIRSAEDFAALCRVLGVIVLCLLPFALYEAHVGRPILVEYLRRIPGLTSVAPVYIERRLGLDRVQATFAHPIHFGLFCSVAFSLTFVALQGIMSDTKRWVISGLVLMSGALALSSGALLAMVLQIGLIAWYVTLRDVKQRWWILVGLFALAYVVIDLLSNRTPLRVFMSYATFSAQTAYWRSIIFEWGIANVLGSAEKGIPSSIWVGIGLNDWIRPHFMPSRSIDNFWLVMTVRYGVPGFALLAVGYLIMIGRVMRRDFSGDERLEGLRRAWVFTFIGLTFTLCTVHIWTNLYSFVFFMFGAGVWFLSAEPNGRAEDAEAAETGRSGMSFARGGSGTATVRAPQALRATERAVVGRDAERAAMKRDTDRARPDRDADRDKARDDARQSLRYTRFPS